MGPIFVGAIFLLGVCALSTASVLTLRRNAYRRLLKYDPRQDHLLGCAFEGVEEISTECDPTGFILPELSANTGSVCLELRLRSSARGSVLDPSIEICHGNFCDRQFFERGVCGARFLNLTRLVRAGVKTGDRVALRGFCLTWSSGTVNLHVCRESVRSDDRVLVIAPHPDDAELAAFGLYADTRATIVTVTAGDGSDRYDSDTCGLRLSRREIARMRVLDSLIAPQLGGIPLEQILNLAYPDGKLSAMQRDRSGDFCCDCSGSLDFKTLRQLNRSHFVRDEGTCSWESLIADLAHIIDQLKPTVVLAPHPWLDPHLDHQFTTLAVSEAMDKLNLNAGRFYFYVNHNRRSELWPFGPSRSGVAMLPLLPGDVVGCESFYSHNLSLERQREKLVALESMHDLRDFTRQDQPSFSARLSRIRSEIAGIIHGMGSPPTSYFRRAVRPDELFFVASFEHGRQLCARLLGEIAGQTA